MAATQNLISSAHGRATLSRVSRPPISLLITDVDNTLYDWFKIWYTSFGALLREIVQISGVDQETVERDIRVVHQRVGTSEYSHLIQELPCLQARHAYGDYVSEYRPAIEAAQAARAKVTELYPGVNETLLRIRESGVPIVAYTESLAYYTAQRFRNLKLDGLIDRLYSPSDHEFPDGVTAQDLRSFPDDLYDLSETKMCVTPPGHLKPEPVVLASILREFDVNPQQTLYVGDSLMKDIAMAQKVGVLDAYAAYGQVSDPAKYELLQRVSHWRQYDVEREAEIRKRPNVTPTYTLDKSFAEIADIFSFERS